MTTLLSCRELSLRSIKLEGNPLCRDYIDPAEYVRIIRMIFTEIVEIVSIILNDDLHERVPGSIPNVTKTRLIKENF